ncbi:MAG: hypothetical protein ABIA74_06245 [bacterium]
MNTKKIFILLFLTIFFIPHKISVFASNSVATNSFETDSTELIKLLSEKKAKENFDKITKLNEEINLYLTHKIENLDKYSNLTEKTIPQLNQLNNFLKKVDEEIEKRKEAITDIPVSPYNFAIEAREKHELKEIEKQKNEFVKLKDDIKQKLERLKLNFLTAEEEKNRLSTLKELNIKKTTLEQEMGLTTNSIRKLNNEKEQLEGLVKDYEIKYPKTYFLWAEGQNYKAQINKKKEELDKLTQKIKPSINEYEKLKVKITLLTQLTEDEIDELDKLETKPEIKLTFFLPVFSSVFSSVNKEKAFIIIADLLITFMLTGKPVPAYLLYTNIGSYIDINKRLWSAQNQWGPKIIELTFNILSESLKKLLPLSKNPIITIEAIINNIKTYFDQITPGIIKFPVQTIGILIIYLLKWYTYNWLFQQLIQTVDPLILKPLIANGILAKINIGPLNLETMVKIISLFIPYIIQYEKLKKDFRLNDVAFNLRITKLTKELILNITNIISIFLKQKKGPQAKTLETLGKNWENQEKRNQAINNIALNILPFVNTKNFLLLIKTILKLNGIFFKKSSLIPDNLLTSIEKMKPEGPAIDNEQEVQKNLITLGKGLENLSPVT